MSGKSCQSVGGALFQLFTGFILDYYKGIGNIIAGYNIIFTVCGSAYVVAWGIMHILSL